MITPANTSHHHKHHDHNAQRYSLHDHQPQPSPPLHWVYNVKNCRIGYGSTRQNATAHSCIILDAGDATIHPLAYVNFQSREQLEDLEAAFIVLYRASTVNRSTPGAIRRAGGIAEYLRRRDAGPKRRAYELRRGQTETRRASKRAADRMRRSFTLSCGGLNRVLLN